MNRYIEPVSREMASNLLAVTLRAPKMALLSDHHIDTRAALAEAYQVVDSTICLG